MKYIMKGDLIMAINDKDRAFAILAIHKAMDALDDGYHNEVYMKLVRASNDIYYEMSERNQTKIREYFDKKAEEMAE